MLHYGRKLLMACRLRRKQRRAVEERRQELRLLREEIGECRRQLRVLEGWYDLAADPHTVDSCIFQLCALQARYEGLLRQARQIAVQGQSAAGTEKSARCIQYEKAAKTAELSAQLPQ